MMSGNRLSERNAGMDIDSEILEADAKLRAKVLSKFGKFVVRKDLAFQVKGNLPVPTYVIEYLLAQYCQSDDDAVIAEGIEKVKEIVREHYFNRADHEIIKGRIHDRGSYMIIDKVSAYLDAAGDCYRCDFANLGLGGLVLPNECVAANEKLLSGTGVWSLYESAISQAMNQDHGGLSRPTSLFRSRTWMSMNTRRCARSSRRTSGSTS